MDYAFDFYLNVGTNEEFIYDDHRYFSKLYVFLKLIGFITYTITLSSCENPEFYTVMMTAMFISLLNSARFEYKHYQKFGTQFSSVHDFEVWNNSLWSKSRAVFSVIEYGIKIAYFIKIYPPVIDFRTTCNVGESIYKIHIIGVFSCFIFCIFSVCLLSNSLCRCICSTLCCCDPYTELHQIRTLRPVSVPMMSRVSITPPSEVVLSTTQECCICMDNETTQSWSYLPCGHLFHASCVSIWFARHHTCPVCRYDLRDAV